MREVSVQTPSTTVTSVTSRVIRVSWSVSPVVTVPDISSPQNYTFTMQYMCLSSYGQPTAWVNGSSVTNYNTGSADISGLVRNTVCTVRVQPYRQQFDVLLADTPSGTANITLSEFMDVN